MNQWIELRCTTSSDYADTLSDQLLLLEAEAITFEDAGDNPIFEPNPDEVRLWQQTIVVGLFNADADLTHIIAYLEQQESEGSIQHFHIKHVKDEVWERTCLSHFKPLSFGKKLWICPSWEQPPNPNAVIVNLDPGLAFGTGSHQTTALCLEWLDEYVDSDSLIIDYGCGSGILALAAIKLGAKKVLAVDNDPQALEATRLNSERNQLHADTIETLSPHDILALSPKADLLIANILATPLISLAKTFYDLTKPRAKIALSGILKEQVEQVIDAYRPYFELTSVKNKDNWVRITGIRK